MQIRTSAGGASPGPARRQGAGRGRDWRSRAYRRPRAWAAGGWGWGGRRKGAGGGREEEGAGEVQGEGSASLGEGHWREGTGPGRRGVSAAGRGGVESLTGPRGSGCDPSPAAYRLGRLPRLSFSAYTAQGPLPGATEASTAVSICTELHHVQTPWGSPAGGGIGAGAARAPTLYVPPPRPAPRGLGHLGRRGMGRERIGRRATTGCRGPPGRARRGERG